jgi:hypothetical protein
MNRCGRDELHEPHEWIDEALRYDCDGRTRNEPMVGQLLTGELYEALGEEHHQALVAVEMEDGKVYPMRLLPDRHKGGPVFMLGVWRKPDE